ncbi:hypothetical protein BGX31_003337 [Mortierella sp. GBA43]|nr:hypothetical protein BGX31_003337 [Mortierella sp. GBA43]
MYSATKSRSPLDKYKTVLLVNFETPSIDMKPNADYNTTLVGRQMETETPDVPWGVNSRTRVRRFLRPLKDAWTSLFGVSRKEAEEWHGLPRYNQNISQDSLNDNKFAEYAMVRNILQCNELGLRYYADVADYDLPEWGIDLMIDEAVITYGPWADRQRVEIQNFYFPNSFRTVDITPEAKPGQDRIHPALHMMVTFTSAATIKIPTQEKSKDWKYSGPEFQAVQGGKSMRPFGWLEFKADPGSMISVNIPMKYTADGYKNVVLVQLQNLVVTSSVNYAPLIKLNELKRDWDFEVTLDSAEIHILRDHITLIQDLSKDWTSGPAVDMAHFVPFKYDFDIKLPNFQLFTYVNEHNIINEPTEDDDNAFIVAYGKTLDCKVVLPFVQYNPETTTISFDVEIQDGGLDVRLPLAHTLGEFTGEVDRKFGEVPSVAIKGSYEYYDFVDPNHIETLNLDVKGHGVMVKLFGHVIRYVLILMDNYAGLYPNFVTMEEYRKKRDNPDATERAERKQANAKPPCDPYEVYVHFTATDTKLLLPENLYTCDSHSEITCAEIQLDMRNLDVYMDMDVAISPLTWSRKVKDTGVVNGRSSQGNQNYLFVDGISIYAHRLFGPLPKTTTYVANWKLDLGSIYGQIKPSFLLGVSSFAKTFVYNLKDGDNAFPPEYATVIPPDITIVDLSVKEVDVSVWGEDVVSQILLKDGVIVHFDDIINERYMGRVVLKLQSLLVRSMALTDTNKDGHFRETEPSQHDHAPWVEIASLNCAFDVTVYLGAGDWRERREKQQAFIREQDRETLRCPYIYSKKGQGRKGSDNDSDTESDDSERNWDDESDDMYSSGEDGSENEYDFQDMAQDHEEDDISDMPSAPARSIPYSTYLKRYTAPSNRTGNHRQPYHPPPRVVFSQSQIEEILEDVPRHHPYVNFDEAFRTKDTQDTQDTPISTAHPKGNGNSDEKRVTIIVEATQDVKILLTPILLKIIQEFLEAVNAEEWNLETMLDVTQMEYVDLLMHITPCKLRSQQFLVNIPRVHLRFIQDVMMPDALNGGDDINMIKTRYDLSGANLCAIDIVLDDAAIIAAVKLEDQEFEKFDSTKIYIPSYKMIESRANVDFSRFKLNARFVSASTVRIFGIPDARHQFSRLGINHLSYLKEPVIADISFERFKLRLLHSSNPNYFSADLEKFTVMFINQSAEIVAGSICSWLTFVKDLKTILHRFQLRRSKQLQKVFSEIAEFSKGINTDPVFLTRPSPTLRLGTMVFRYDDGWKLLAHIRHCMRLMPKDRAKKLHDSLKRTELESSSTEEMYQKVIAAFSDWRSWEMNDLRQCRLFMDVFEKKNVDDPLGASNASNEKESWIFEMLRYSTNSVQLRLGELEATIYDEQMENRMKVTGLEFVFESRYKRDEVAQENMFPGAPLSGEKTNRLSTGFLDVAVKTGFKNAEVDVNPVIIAFTRHILRIERIFTPQFNKILESSVDKRPLDVGRKSLENPTSPRQSIYLPRETTMAIGAKEDSFLDVINRFDVVFTGMAVIETIRITLTAHNLSAQVIFSQIQISALNFAKQRTFPNQDVEGISVAKSSGSNQDGATIRSGVHKLIASVAINISNITSTLKERVYSSDSSSSMSSRELLKFGISGINSEAALSQFTPAKRPKQTKASVPREVISLLVTFKLVRIELPRSILKLYMFAKDWREENMQSFDFLFQGVMNEWEADRNQQPKVVTPPTPRELKVQVVLKKFELESHMLPSLDFLYGAEDLMIMLHDVPPGLQSSIPQLTYTVQLMRQSVEFIAKHPKGKGNERSWPTEDTHTASFSLPEIRASGSVMNVIDSSSPARTRRTSISALARGARQPKRLESSVSFDFVEMTLNVNILDHILTAQSLLGAEINELVDIFAKGSKTAPVVATSSTTSPAQNDSSLLYSVKISLVGLSIAAVSPSAVLYFDTDLLRGVVTNNPTSASVTSFNTDLAQSKLAWRVYAQNITLSLNHHAENIRFGSRAEDIRARKLRLAYITINLIVQNFNPNPSDKERFVQSSVSSFYVNFVKVHALMQPQSVSKMIGLYAYYTSELERRKELKASDMAKLADNTKRIIKSLDVEVPVYKDNPRSMLEATEIFLEISDVAVAIPLDRREDIMSSSERQVEAFLISATSINVLTKSGETSSGTLRQLCAQFVPKFDQSKDEHFRSRSHPKMNRLLFPNVSCQVESTRDSPGHQLIRSKASVSGFELDIDPNIVRYLNTLADVYDNSKDLVSSLSMEQPNVTPVYKTDGSSSTSSIKNEDPPPQTGNTVIWKIENTFQCSKSVCRFYPKSYIAKLPKSSKYMESESNFAHVGAEVSGVDRFIIPGLSLWTSLLIPLGDDPMQLQAAGPPRIHAEINIHSCENTFYPSLVPFFQDIVTGLKIGIRKQRQYPEHDVIVPTVQPTSTSTAQGGEQALPGSSSAQESVGIQQLMNKKQALVVSCYLCIEKTKIEFNCQPMAKVMSVLTLEQGGILMSYNSDRAGNASTTIAGTFEGASSDTHHIFSQDKGFILTTKGMIFNVVAETNRQAIVNKKTLSVTADFRQIAVDFDLRQAEMLVLMKMIWMDQANYLIRDGLTMSRSTSTHGFETVPTTQSSGETASMSAAAVDAAEAPSTGGAPGSGKRESSFLGYNVFIVARLQQMRIIGDLGSQVAKMDFKLDEVQLRTKLRPFHPRSASISIGPLDLRFLPTGKNWLEGYVVMEGVNLETLSKVNRHADFPCSVMEIVLQTGRMTSMLSHDAKLFFIMAVEPARLVMQDHWEGPDLASDVTQAIVAHLHGLRVLAGAKTVPVFENLKSRLMKTIKQRTSTAKDVLKPAKQLLSASTLQSNIDDNPSAPSHGGDSLLGNIKTILQGAWNAKGRVQVSVDDLDLSLFPYLLSDKECTHACVQGFKLKLDRNIIESANEKPVIHRLTTIALGLLGLQKYTLQAVDQKTLTLEQWFDRIKNPNSTTIAKVPATTQIMESWQAHESLVIEHICKTQFAGLIDIATDYRLFRGVEKNIQRFLEELRIREFKNKNTRNIGDETAKELNDVDGSGELGANVRHETTTVNSSADQALRVNPAAIGRQDSTSTIASDAEGRDAASLGQSAGQGSKRITQTDLALASSPTSPVPTPISDDHAVTSATNQSIPEDGANHEKATGTSSGSTDEGQQVSRTNDLEEPQLTFQAREQIVFKPALDVLPNTPLPLGQLGFKKEDIPPIVHVVTTALETGLLTVAEIHAKKIELSGLHDLWEGRVIMDDDEEDRSP